MCLYITTMYYYPALDALNFITRTGEGGIPCGDHVNFFMSLHKTMKHPTLPPPPPPRRL